MIMMMFFVVSNDIAHEVFMIVVISMLLEIYSSFYGDPSSCYILDYIEMYHRLLLRYHYDTY